MVTDKVVPPSVVRESEAVEDTDDALRAALTVLIDNRQANAEPEDSEAGISFSRAAIADKTQSTVLSRADIQRLEDEHRVKRGTAHDENEQLEDAVFLRSYIPRNLNEVYDPERDAAKVRRGEGNELIYGGITGVVEANPTAAQSGSHADAPSTEGHQGVGQEGGDTEDSDDDENSEGGSDDENGGEGQTDIQKRPPRGHRHEDKDAKKVRRSHWLIKSRLT